MTRYRVTQRAGRIFVEIDPQPCAKIGILAPFPNGLARHAEVPANSGVGDGLTPPERRHDLSLVSDLGFRR